MTPYTAYVNYGNMPLWKQIMEMRPWVDEANAKRIAEEALERTMSVPLKNRRMERVGHIAKYIWAETKKLRGQEGE